MTFQCSLRGPTEVPVSHAATEPLADVDPTDMDTYDELVIYACDLLSDTDARFHLGGFGRADWNLDIGYDFAFFAAELPDLLRALPGQDEFELFLGSQGVQQQLIFYPGAEVKIRCVSGTSWVPDPDVEVISLSELLAMLTKLAADFARAVDLLDHRVTQREPFRSWLAGDFS